MKKNVFSVVIVKRIIIETITNDCIYRNL